MNRIEAFGVVIRDARLERGHTQEHLAELAGLHRNFISLVERGASSAALDSIFALSDALEIPASELFERVENLLRI